MKKLIALFLLLSISAFADDPKFLFMDRVRIVSGFYKGCIGDVKSYVSGTQDHESLYEVSVDRCKDHFFYDNFKESELEKVKKK